MNHWAPPPAELPVLDDSVQVWAVRLDDAGVDLERGRELLSPEERERAARFRFDIHRRRYLVAHIALHDILSGYLAIEPARLSFDLGANGKPRLPQELGAGGVEFNLSHSNEMALLAVTRGAEVGVDIEHAREKFEFQEVAERFFTAKEVAAMRGLPAALQRQAFYKCWTSKEAFLKAKGTGLSGALDEVEISLNSDNQVRITANVPGWALSELAPIADYEAALVVRNAPTPKHCYQWQIGILPDANRV
ncbi:MAG: 4'-phosphopantetheinyl transferase superfamily protein [Deltaproteobacteria bacterium]|nr:4'-phosphopantetheinyl transferase superfamily protein [Deltaproteobacteria bacterium]